MPYTPPSRWSYWASRLYYRTAAGPSPYVAGTTDSDGGGGYGLDFGEHYDPELGFLNVQAHSDANGLGIDASAQVAAAEHNYRDLAVRAVNGTVENEETPGVPQWHVFLAGVAKHYLAGGSVDAADEEAAEILISGTSYADDQAFRDDKFHVGQQRELALALWAMCEKYAMGLGEHPRTDTAAELAMGHLDQWSAPPETRRYGIWCKLFMAALTCRALTRYLELFGDSADAGKAANCAAIPGKLAAFADWVWTDGWIGVGVSTPVDGGTWDRGTIRYMTPAHDNPILDDIPGLAVTAVVDPRRVFNGPASLSALDDHYTGAAFQVDGIEDQFNIVGYVGATRRITLGTYAPGRDITTSDTFSIRTNPVNRDLTEHDGGSPDLNHMVFPLYAWLYRYYKVTAPDADLATTARSRAHAVFDGCLHSWQDAFAQKQYNQSALWTTDGLGWLEEGDTAADPGGGETVLILASPQGGYLFYDRGSS